MNSQMAWRQRAHVVAEWAQQRPGQAAVTVVAGAKLAMLIGAWLLLERPEDFISRLALAWDGEHFSSLANHGWQETKDFAFAPLYPLMVRWLGGTPWAMLVMNNGASLIAVALIARLMGLGPALFLGLFPVWLVFSSVGYSEGLYTALAATAFLALGPRTRDGVRVGAAAALASLTRYSGAVGFAGFGLWMLVRQRRSAWPFLAIGALAAAAVALWHHGQTNDVFVYFEAQKNWGAATVWPWQQLDWVLHGWFTNHAVVRSSTHPSSFWLRGMAVWTLAAVGLWRLHRASRHDLLAYSLPIVVLVVCTEGMPAISLPRLVLAAFPAIAIHGASMTRHGMLAYGAVSLPLGTWILIQHVTGQFFA